MTVKFLGCRTQFEVRVGRRHSVDVVLHIRREDMNRMRTAEKWGEVLLLLQESILPRLFHDEIEISTARLDRKKLPPDLGIGGIPVITGEKNHLSRRKKASATDQGHQQQDPTKKHKEIYYAFGKSVKLAYRLQETKSAPSATFLVNEAAQCRNKRYRLLSKLSKTICVWGYSCDVINSSGDCLEGADDVMLSAGRPELIPTAALFRRAS
jgi:hypothetical protein